MSGMARDTPQWILELKKNWKMRKRAIQLSICLTSYTVEGERVNMSETIELTKFDVHNHEPSHKTIERLALQEWIRESRR